MKEGRNVRSLLIATAVGVLVPSGVFLAAAVGTEVPLTLIPTAFAEQLTGNRNNLMAISVLGVVPFAALALVLFLYRMISKRTPVPEMLFGGALASVMVLVWANATYWFSFLPERTFQMFPHGMELIIEPVFFAPPAMVIGVLVGWFFGREKSAA